VSFTSVAFGSGNRFMSFWKLGSIRFAGMMLPGNWTPVSGSRTGVMVFGLPGV